MGAFLGFALIAAGKSNRAEKCVLRLTRIEPRVLNHNRHVTRDYAKNHHIDVRLRIFRVENADRLVTHHLRRGAVAIRRDVTFRDRPLPSSNHALSGLVLLRKSFRASPATYERQKRQRPKLRENLQITATRIMEGKIATSKGALVLRKVAKTTAAK